MKRCKMQIKIIERIPFADLVARIRRVPLKKSGPNGPVYPYDAAHFSLHQFSPDEVNPTSFYVLEKNLEVQNELQSAMLEQHGIDTLLLEQGVIFATDDGVVHTITPPIIELAMRRVVFVPGEGEIVYNTSEMIRVMIVNDGIHRVYMARGDGELFNGLLISGADQSYPFYAHPNDWSKVNPVKELPGAKGEKKLYRRDDCYALYRDFGVLGCGDPRGTKGGM